jgi:hypothetical protein
MNEKRPTAAAEMLEANGRHYPRIPSLRGDEHVYRNRNLRPFFAPVHPENERFDGVPP